MKILIVEDEKRPREGLFRTLKELYPWIQLLPPAENGESAILCITSDKPDIIITDIQMPGTDGLDMIQHVIEENYHPYIIVISGYSNFSYAQKALSLGVQEYILKPYSIEDVQKKIDTAIRIAALRHTGLDEESIKNSDGALLLRYHRSIDPSELMIYMTTYLSKFSGHSLLLSHQYDTHRQIMAITYTYKENNATTAAFTCKDIIHRLSFRFPDCVVGVYISGNRILEEQNLIHNLLYAHIFYDLEPIISIDSFNIWEKEKTETFSFNYDTVISEPFFRFDKELFEERVQNWIESLRNQTLSPLRCYKEMVTLLFKLHVTIISLNKDEQDLFFLEHVLSLLGDIFSPKSLLKMITNKFPSSLSKRCLTDYSTKKCNNPLVMKTLTYVYQHIHESISLEIIAEAIQVSAEHLSRVFKAEMDIGFNSYINQLKIEHAKTYIRIKNMEIQEVADVLGYSSPRYFNKVFKKVTGLTVKEFCQQKPL